MKQTVIVLDGNPTHLSYLKQIIAAHSKNGAFEIAAYSDAVMFDRDLQARQAAVAFIDMDITDVNMVHLVRRIRDASPEVHLVLLTETGAFELGAYELRASYYLSKPASAFKVQAIMDALDSSGKTEATDSDCRWFSIETKKRTVRVAYEDIVYIEKDQRKVVVHTLVGTWSFYGTFKEVLTVLQADGNENRFAQCHKGFIVNTSEVASLDSEGLQMNDGSKVAVSRRFRQSIERMLKEIRSVGI